MIAKNPNRTKPLVFKARHCSACNTFIGRRLPTHCLYRPPRRQLRSSAGNTTHARTSGQFISGRSFLCRRRRSETLAGTVCWMDLSFGQFRRAIKTHLFVTASLRRLRRPTYLLILTYLLNNGDVHLNTNSSLIVTSCSEQWTGRTVYSCTCIDERRWVAATKTEWFWSSGLCIKS